MKRWLLITVLLCVGSTKAQVVQLQGGVSNQQGSGGGITFFAPNSEMHFQAGINQGQFAYAASEHFEFHKWDVVAGDNQFALTSGVQMSLMIPVRGVSAYKQTAKSSWYIFGGAVGDIYSAPFFYGIQHAHLGAGIAYHREVAKDLVLGTIQEADVRRKTSLGEFEWKPSCNIAAPKPPLAGAGAFQHCWWNHLLFRGSGGLLQSNPQFGGDAQLQTKHLTLDASRRTFVFETNIPGQVNPIVPRVTTNSYSAYTNIKFVSMYGSRFESGVNKGTAIGAGVNFSWLGIGVSDYRGGLSHTQMATVTEHTIHWNFSQYLTRSQNGSYTANGGLGYSGNRLNFQISHNVLFFPGLPNRPFQQVLSISFGLRFRAVTTNSAVIMQPGVTPQWLIGGQDYENIGIHLPGIPVGQDPTRNLPDHGHGGKYTITGMIVDTEGNPVEGAAVMVNKDLCFTDTHGRFSVQEKQRDNRILLDINQFMSGQWEVVDSPSQAHAGEAVRIVVRRK